MDTAIYRKHIEEGDPKEWVMILPRIALHVMEGATRHQIDLTLAKPGSPDISLEHYRSYELATEQEFVQAIQAVSDTYADDTSWHELLEAFNFFSEVPPAS